jgi:uncharacterized repeat protein (TIGR04138 family)
MICMADASVDNLSRVEQVAEKDNRFKLEAYVFVMMALERTVSELSVRRHITARELLSGAREHAIEKYGPMAKAVLNHWGVKDTADIGELVFNLIDAGVLAKTETDTKEDFRNVFDFEDVFVREYEW